MISVREPLLVLFLLSSCTPASAQNSAGRKLILEARAANCIDCHRFPNDPGIATRATVGPELSVMKARFPDRAQLIARIGDATAFNPDSIMPPYGKHKILSEREIGDITDFLYTQ